MSADIETVSGDGGGAGSPSHPRVQGSFRPLHVQCAIRRERSGY